ncbi:prolyl oligopeptidase family serine peptidase [Quadrisphaera sp. KR29]|uniref:prolyl oligopeptidase family serine peptidase n=1 Tax=Quadrisphaera sp. KR29 TaxID=3461391 RepID=UPI0040440BF9
MSPSPSPSPPASPAHPGYPPAERLGLVEELPAAAPRYRVADPYRWLEDPEDERTRAWSAAQDALFAAHRQTWPGRDAVAARVAQLLSAGAVGPPVWRGERCFRARRDPGRDHPQLLVSEVGPDGAAGAERVLVDPLAWDPSGRTTLDAWQPSREGRLLAFQLSEGGSEESVLRVLDVATGEVVDGPVERVRYSPVSWLPEDPDDGSAGAGARFFYVRRLPPEGLPAGEEKYHRRVWLHRVGADPDAAPADGGDVEVFGADQPITTYYGVGTSLDGRWLAVTTSVGTSPRSDCYLADLAADGGLAAGPPRLRPVAVGLDAHTSAGVGRDGRLYVGTDLGAPRGRLAVADPTDPAGRGPERWRDLVGEREDAVLEDYAVLDGPELEQPVLLVAWTQHAVARLTVHDLASGEQLPGERGVVALPGAGSLGGLRGRPEGGHEAWFTWTSTAELPCVLRWDARTGDLSVESTAPGLASMGELPAVVTRQLEVTSLDGTVVRALAVARADAFSSPGAAAPEAPAPTVLYGYGGFGHTMTPGYSASALAWVEAGGVWVVAGLRGGNEEGEAWHRAGMLAAKQNVFDDFLAVADALAERGWTTPAQLTVSGGSNGGLLVGAALTQRPDAFAAVLCSAPLLDMVRYQLHGLGATWSPEYGDAERPDDLGWLLAYSPYHACSPDPASVEYPAVLFTVFDGDSRVDPLHARKLCAALQHATRSDQRERPVLLRREAGVGHGARAVSRTVELAADTLCFAAAHTGLRLPPQATTDAEPSKGP